jgi:hypothetical protein
MKTRIKVVDVSDLGAIFLAINMKGLIYLVFLSKTWLANQFVFSIEQYTSLTQVMINRKHRNYHNCNI